MNRTIFLNQKRSPITHNLIDYEESCGDALQMIQFPEYFNQAQWLDQLCIAFNVKQGQQLLILDSIAQSMQSLSTYIQEYKQLDVETLSQNINYKNVKCNEDIDLISTIMILYSMDEGLLLGSQEQLHNVFQILIPQLEQALNQQVMVFLMNTLLTKLSLLSADDIFMIKYYMNEEDKNMLLRLYVHALETLEIEMAYTLLIILYNIYDSNDDGVNNVIEQSIQYIADSFNIIEQFKHHNFRQLISEICDIYLQRFNESSIPLLKLTTNLVLNNNIYESNQLCTCFKYIKQSIVNLNATISDSNIIITVNSFIEQQHKIINNLNNEELNLQDIHLVTFNIQQFAEFYLYKARNKSLFNHCIDFIVQKLTFILTKQQLLDVYQILFRTKIFQTNNNIRFSSILSIINIELLRNETIEQVVSYLIENQTIQNILTMTRVWTSAFHILGEKFKMQIFKSIVKKLNSQQLYDVEFVSRHLLEFADIIENEPNCLDEFLSKSEVMAANTPNEMPYYNQLCQYIGYNE